MTSSSSRQHDPATTLQAMDSEALRDLCLSLRGSDETFPFGFGTSVFKVADRIFAISRLSELPLSVSLKCEPALAEQLRAVHPAGVPAITSTNAIGTRSSSMAHCPTR